MKANPLRRPAIAVVAAAALFVPTAPCAAALFVPTAVFGWSSRARVFRAVPRRGGYAAGSSSSSFMSSASRRSGGGDDGGTGDDDDDDRASVGIGRDDDPAEGHDDTNDDDDDDDDDDEGRRRLLSYVSRLEAIYEGGGGFVGLLDDTADLFVAEDDVDADVAPSLGGGGRGGRRRVVLGDWLVGGSRGGDEVCAGDSCGDDSDQCDIPEEYKGWNSGPRVDVMAFLGIRLEGLGLRKTNVERRRTTDPPPPSSSYISSFLLRGECRAACRGRGARTRLTTSRSSPPPREGVGSNAPSHSPVPFPRIDRLRVSHPSGFFFGDGGYVGARTRDTLPFS
ncbi:hypothetical protein ACHAW5_006321 [Stephanodiscus triporus]|uniref:Uncharacterized protein n=1 Tax=Stephanodiscus triporus TaxID=2934178 RepID=A0ABD3MK14_9STRA